MMWFVDMFEIVPDDALVDEDGPSDEEQVRDQEMKDP